MRHNSLSDLSDDLRHSLRTNPAVLADFSARRPPVSQEQILRQGLYFWLPQAKGDPACNRLLTKEYADDFCFFLYRLGKAGSRDNAIFRQQIARWLEQLTQDDNQQLRIETFKQAHAVNASLLNKDTACYVHMMELIYLDKVQKGEYDNQPAAELYTLCQSLFHLYRLEVIAHNKAEEFREEVEDDPDLADDFDFFLSYQAHLAYRLQLGDNASELRIAQRITPELTEAELSAAVAKVKQYNSAQFWLFLCQNCQPWQAMLARRFPHEYQIMRNSLDRVAADNAQIDRYIHQQGLSLTNDEQANQKLRNQVKNQMLSKLRLQHLQPLSYQFYPALRQL